LAVKDGVVAVTLGVVLRNEEPSRVVVEAATVESERPTVSPPVLRPDRRMKVNTRLPMMLAATPMASCCFQFTAPVLPPASWSCSVS
jgi:hypothetical protein